MSRFRRDISQDLGTSWVRVWYEHVHAASLANVTTLGSPLNYAQDMKPQCPGFVAGGTQRYVVSCGSQCVRESFDRWVR